MSRFVLSLAGGGIFAVALYLACALPQYFYLRAHQPHWAVVNDRQQLTFALPQAQGQHLEATDPNITSFPPSAALVLDLPFALIAFVGATLALWLGQILLAKRRRV